VTHDQEEAFDLADRVVIFNRGIIEQAGAPGDIIRAPATPFVMNFVGDTNSVPAGCQLVRRSGHMPGSKARVMFRPGDMRVRTVFSDAPMPGGGSLTPATVAERASLGWAVRYVLRFDDDVEVEYETTLAAEAAADAAGETVSSGVLAGRLDVGQRVYVHVPPGGMMAFDPAEVDSAPVVS
jgi:sulfate/thiosulfate transport system ATP-binding protein